MFWNLQDARRCLITDTVLPIVSTPADYKSLFPAESTNEQSWRLLLVFAWK